MKPFLRPALFVCLVAGLGAYSTAVADSPASTADKTAPSYDMKPQSILDLHSMQKKFVDLAKAIPEDKYGWRPGEGVRSVSELFLHISAANYTIPNMMGVPLPAGFDQKGFEKSTKAKAQVMEELNKSFGSAIAAIEAMTNADFAKPDKKLGPDANDGDVVYILVSHAHEHLGQAIAYARLNGVVPPWTEEAMKKKAAAQQ